MLTNFGRTALFLATNVLLIFLAQNFNISDHLIPFLTPWKRPAQDQYCEPSMPNHISLTPWLRSRFTSLYESAPPPEEADFKALFLSTFSDDAQVIRNHENVSVETFQEKLTAANFALTRASVEWKDLVEISEEGEEAGSQAGIVAGVFVVTRSMKFRIRAGPAQRINHNTFSAKISVDPNAQPDSDGSKRRITQLFITSSDRAAPIHLQGIPPQPAPVSDIDPILLEKKS